MLFRSKSLVLRGMGLFEIANPNLFLEKCAQALSLIKKRPLLSKKGCIEFPAAIGEEDISEWISPLVHRHSSCFNCPYPSNTFVKYNEDPKILKESDVEEPGYLITDVYALLAAKKLGLSAELSCRFLEACAKYGIDAVAASKILQKKGISDIEKLKNELTNLKPPFESPGISRFSPWSPQKPLFSDFGLPRDGSQDGAWWVRRQAVAYLFGIHPIFALMVPELSEDLLIDLFNTGTDLGITNETLDHVVADVSK